MNNNNKKKQTKFIRNHLRQSPNNCNICEKAMGQSVYIYVMSVKVFISYFYLSSSLIKGLYEEINAQLAAIK